MEVKEPWYLTADSCLVAELRRELPRGHALHGLPVTTVARRQDRDEVLYRIDDELDRYAVVHLTYQVETQADWPQCTMFASADVWLRQMDEDHALFDA